MLKQLAMFTVALVMVLSAVSIVTADGISTSTSNHAKFGNYLLENTTQTGSFNLSYVNDNAHILVANSINATGQAISSTGLSKFSTDSAVNLGSNLTVFTSGSEKTLLLGTQSPLTGSVTPSITLNLTTPVSKVVLNSQQTSFLSNHSVVSIEKEVSCKDRAYGREFRIGVVKTDCSVSRCYHAVEHFVIHEIGGDI